VPKRFVAKRRSNVFRVLKFFIRQLGWITDIPDFIMSSVMSEPWQVWRLAAVLGKATIVQL